MSRERRKEPELYFGKVYRSYIKDIRDRGIPQSSGLETKLFTMGFILTIIGIMLMSLAPFLGGTKISSSGVIVIVGFPFLIPVGIAWGPHGLELSIIGLVISLVMIIIALIILKKR